MVTAYKRWRKIPSLREISPERLEQLSYGLSVADISENADKLHADLLWCDPGIKSFVASLYFSEERARLKELPKTVALQTILKEDMAIVRDKFPRLRSLEVGFITMEDGLIFRDEDGDLANTFQCEAVIILSFIPMSFLHCLSMARKRLCYFSNR